MGKVVLYISISLDGYIADTAGGVDWLGGEKAGYQGDYGYRAFWETVDAIVMGGRTYRQVRRELSPDVWPYEGKAVYVLTHQVEEAAPAGVHFVTGPIKGFLCQLREQNNGSVWICGGADVVAQCLPEIEEYHLSVMPVLLGDGIPLFQPGRVPQALSLMSLRQENGVVQCVYTKG